MKYRCLAVPEGSPGPSSPWCVLLCCSLVRDPHLYSILPTFSHVCHAVCRALWPAEPCSPESSLCPCNTLPLLPGRAAADSASGQHLAAVCTGSPQSPFPRATSCHIYTHTHTHTLLSQIYQPNTHNYSSYIHKAESFLGRSRIM